jgi:hypothetical protein
MQCNIIKVAAVQAAPVAFDLAKSITKIAEFTAEAAASGADLIVFPYVVYHLDLSSSHVAQRRLSFRIPMALLVRYYYWGS